MLLPVSILFSWLLQGHVIFSGPFSPYGVLVFFVHTPEYAFSLGHWPTSTDTYYHLQDDCYNHLFLQPCHIHFRHAPCWHQNVPAHLSRPTASSTPNIELNDPFKRSQHCKLFFLETLFWSEPPICHKPKVARRVVSLSKRWLPQSYSPRWLTSLKVFQLLCLKGSHSVLIANIFCASTSKWSSLKTPCWQTPLRNISLSPLLHLLCPMHSFVTESLIQRALTFLVHIFIWEQRLYFIHLWISQ